MSRSPNFGLINVDMAVDDLQTIIIENENALGRYLLLQIIC